MRFVDQKRRSLIPTRLAFARMRISHVWLAIAMACSGAQPTGFSGSRCPAEPVPGAFPGPCTLERVCVYDGAGCACKAGAGSAVGATGDTHWNCFRFKRRADGCPDFIEAGMPCHDGQVCQGREGDECGRLFDCESGVFVQTRDTCAQPGT